MSLFFPALTVYFLPKIYSTKSLIKQRNVIPFWNWNSFFSIYSYEVYQCLKKNKRDFAGGPVVKTSPSNAGGAVLSLVGELRTHMPCRQKPKT